MNSVRVIAWSSPI